MIKYYKKGDDLGFLSIFVIMQRKKNISKFLFVVALLFTVVFQFVHTLSHAFNDHKTITLLELNLAENFSEDDHSHTVAEWHTDHQIEKCFACDFFLSPFITTEVLVYDLFDVQVITKAQDLVSLSVIPLSQIYYSLRAPPTFI